jgi:hypothetical protein
MVQATNRFTDLFGEIPVTNAEILAWVHKISPGHLGTERRFFHYVRTYDVVGKIRASKARGEILAPFNARCQSCENLIQIRQTRWQEALKC